MKQRIIISAIYTSPPNSMGGNTKIIIEMINNTREKYEYIIVTSQPNTFINAITAIHSVTIIPIPFPYQRNNRQTHIKEVYIVYKEYKKIFIKLNIGKNDICITQSDFAPDVIPIFLLQKKLQYCWIPTLFLFIPPPIDNLLHRYFPFLKYCLYRIYQQYMFFLMKSRGRGFIITNHSDLIHFKSTDIVLPIYGGVNIEQIQHNNKTKKYDAVFCGRLHPQKGVLGLLDIWYKVTKAIPGAKLGIIGNGDKTYEQLLQKKCVSLGLIGNIERLGYVNNKEKYSIYAQSQVFVHTSVYDNNGMVAAEALCQGLPVVMFDLPALRKVYTIGCHKIQLGNKSAYAKKIIKLIHKPILLNDIQINKLQYQWARKNKAKEYVGFIEKISLLN